MVYRAFIDYNDEEHAPDSHWLEMSWNRYTDNDCHHEDEYNYDDTPFLSEDPDYDFYLELVCEEMDKNFKE